MGLNTNSLNISMEDIHRAEKIHLQLPQAAGQVKIWMIFIFFP